MFIPQKFSIIQTLLLVVGAGIARYFPSRDAMLHDCDEPFTRQSSCAFPARSTYSKLDLQPVGLLVTNNPFESAAQSMEEKELQFFSTISLVG